MATYYTVRVGYNAEHKNSEVGKILIEEAKRICSYPHLIVGEAAVGEGKELDFDFAESFKNQTDLTITFKEYSQVSESNQVIMACSGGGYSRIQKAIARRAFCRLLIEAMHKKGMEVCLNVA